MDDPLQCEGWKTAMDVLVDVHRAIEEASRRGEMSNFQRLLLYLYYFLDVPFVHIAEVFDLHEAFVRRQHRAALQAIKDTGVLDGYEGLGEGDASR